MQLEFSIKVYIEGPHHGKGMSIPRSYGTERAAVDWVHQIGQYLPEGHLITFGQIYDLYGKKIPQMISVHSDPSARRLNMPTPW